MFQNEFEIKEMSLNNPSFPSQGNDSKQCGVFVMMFADFYMNDMILDFTLRDMKTFRKKILLSLLNKKLNYSENCYPIYESNKNKYIIKFQSFFPNSYNTLSWSICRELIERTHR